MASNIISHGRVGALSEPCQIRSNMLAPPVGPIVSELMCVGGPRMLLPLDPQRMFGMYEGPRMLLSGTFVPFLLPARGERCQG